MANNKLIVILGPTACGKTKIAAALAAKYSGEIVSADSRQVYRGMDIGTGKDLKDYAVVLKVPELSLRGPRAKRRGRSNLNNKPKRLLRGVYPESIRRTRNDKINVPHHLIDVVNPMADFNVAKYQKLAYAAIDDILKKGKQPFLVGGTGLYIDAVIKGYQLQENTKTRKHKNKKTREKLNKLNLAQLLLKLKKIDSATYRIIDQKNRRRVQRALEIYYETGMPKSKLPENKKPLYEILILGVYPVKFPLQRNYVGNKVFNRVKFPLAKIYEKIDRRLETWLKEGIINEVEQLHKNGVTWKWLEEFGLEYRQVAKYLQKKISYEELVNDLKSDLHHFAKRQLTWFKRNQDIVWIGSFTEADVKIRKFINN